MPDSYSPKGYSFPEPGGGTGQTFPQVSARQTGGPLTVPAAGTLILRLNDSLYDLGTNPALHNMHGLGTATVTANGIAGAATVTVNSLPPLPARGTLLHLPSQTVFTYTSRDATHFFGCVGTPAVAIGDTLTTHPFVIAPFDGLYQAEASIIWDINATVNLIRTLAIIQASSGATRRIALNYQRLANETLIQTLSWQGRLTAGDSLYLLATQNSGAPLNILATAYSPELAMAYIAP